MVTNEKKMTIGGSWLLLTLLMIGMSWTAAVAPATDPLQTPETENAEDIEAVDPLALPETVGTPGDYSGFGWSPDAELLGSRTETSKTYIGKDGEFHALISATPVHYMENGVWEEIDVNLESTPNGWSVTQNSFEVFFDENVARGAEVIAGDDYDPLMIGMAPMVVVVDADTLTPQPYDVAETTRPVAVGGNVIRYPLVTGMDLDYTVTPTQLKQNLVIHDVPTLPDHYKERGYFGLAETMRLPEGYALFLGESPVAEGKIVMTNQSLAIRHRDTGEQLFSIPQPLVTSLDGADPSLNDPTPYYANYIIKVDAQVVTLMIVVETSWLLDVDNRNYPILIDPTLDKGAQRAGYTMNYRYRSGNYYYTYWYVYSNANLGYTCRGVGNFNNGCTSATNYNYYYRNLWYRFDFNSALPSGATVSDADFVNNVGRYNGGGSKRFDCTVLKTSNSQSASMVDPNSYFRSGSGNGGQAYLAYKVRYNARSCANQYISQPNYYYQGGSVRTIEMDNNGIGNVQDAVDGNGGGTSGYILGLGVRNTANAPMMYWCSTNYYSYYGCTTASKRPHLHITYSGGSDTSAPTDEFVPYDGVTSHRNEARTMFFSLKDMTGVDTTTNGGPHLWYRINSGSWTGVRSTSLGSCAASSWCNFKAQIPALNWDDTVQYFLAFQDLKTPTANYATLPAGGSGTPNNPTPPSSFYDYTVEEPEDAAELQSDGTKNNMWRIRITNVNQYSYYNAIKNFDEQLTYYEDSQEWIWDYDTSRCGTGSNSCFNTANVYNLRYSKTITGYSFTNCAATATCFETNPGLTMNARHGPQMSTIWYYNAAKGYFGMVGLGTSTGIPNPIAGTACSGSECTQGGGRNVDDGASAVKIPGDITMKFGQLNVNRTYTSSYYTRNWFCVNSNNHPFYFTSTSASNPYCLYSYTTYMYDRQFNGWQTPGYDGRWMTGTTIYQGVSQIKPMPDTSPPDLDHGGLMDTYSNEARTVSVGIADAGDPPVGVNISSGFLPHMYYRTYNATTTSWTSWTQQNLAPVGSTPAQCEMASCDWAADIPAVDRGNSAEYRISALDNNNNWINTSTWSYTIGSPTKTFTIEWHDANCYYYMYICNYQVKLYDVTNEVELLYDTNSNPYYNWESIGYQKGGYTAIGATLQNRGPGYVNQVNQFDYNYRIATDGSTDHGYERMTAGMTELINYNVEYSGTSNGMPYIYYCMQQWTTYYNQCQTMIDMPDGFEFDWFGTTYNGTQNGKIDAARNGAMRFTNSQSTYRGGMQQMYQYYGGWGYNNWPELPTTTAYANRVHIAPWFGAYGGYYCYYAYGSECSIRTRLGPFEGAGWDIYSDITQDTTWDLSLSPIRIVPQNGDYIRVTGDLTIEPGVEIQFADGKGIDMAGACNNLIMKGNDTAEGRITATSIGSGTGLGFAFTNGGCTTANNDDRHEFEYVDFLNLSTAISAGSRHGNSPHYNGNVGNFTMSDVTFTNVGTAISHGSGQGTGIDLSGVTITGASDDCISLPDDAVLTWVGGGATDCNTMQHAGSAAIYTGQGSSVTLEDVDFESYANGIIGGAADIWMSNVTINSASTSTQSGIALGQTGTQTSGTSLDIYNVDATGFNQALRSHATDDISIDTLSGNNVLLAPGGTSSTVLGASQYAISNVDLSGNFAMTRTTPESMDNIDLDGYLEFSGTAAAADKVMITDLTADGISVVGCGWNVDARDVTLGGGSAGTWATASCTSNSARSTLAIVDGTMAGTSSNGNIAYARNGEVTLAGVDITGNTAWGANVATASTNGVVKLIGVTWQGDDCSDSGGWTGQSECWVAVPSSSGKIYTGGFAQVAAFRVIQGIATFVAHHGVTTTAVTTSGSCPDPETGSNPSPCIVTDVMQVGTAFTDSTGNASAWLAKDMIERVSGSPSVTATYTDHSISISGGAGQFSANPADYWYNSTCTNDQDGGSDCSLPLDLGDQRAFKLEAFPQDWGGSAKDCTWLRTNQSTPSGDIVMMLQIVTLSTTLVLDGCTLEMDSTKLYSNHTAGQQPWIIIKNGGALKFTSTMGEPSFLRGTNANYGVLMDIQSGGTLSVDAGASGSAFLRDGHVTTRSGQSGAWHVGSGGTMSLSNGALVYGSSTTSASTATISVNGGTLLVNDASVFNVGQTGTGIHLENTGTSSLANVNVRGADTGVSIVDAAPSIDGFTLTDNTVGFEINGGMTLPTVFRSTLLSGASRGWTTYEMDISNLAAQYDYIQYGFNTVYNGGNAHPLYNYATSRYYGVYDRMRIEIDGQNNTNVNYGQPSSGLGSMQHSIANDPGVIYSDVNNGGNRLNPGHHSRNDGPARYDCDLYGYQYNPGGSYQYGYYYYFTQYSDYTPNSNTYYGANSYPREMGFTLDIVDGLTGSQNYYPYNYWGYYWHSSQFATQFGGVFAPPQGFTGYNGYYNVCLNYAYSAQTPPPNGYRVSWPIVNTGGTSDVAASENVVNPTSVKAYIDIVHNGHDYFQDKYEFVFRGGNSHGSGAADDILNARWGREFGMASISNGQIDGSTTGIEISGNYGAADFSTVSINSPVNEGILVSGSASTDMSGVTVNDGKYGLRMTRSALGGMSLTSMTFDGQTEDGLVLSKDMSLTFGGAISNAAGSGVRVLSGSSGAWEFSNLALTGNDIGIETDGTGSIMCADCTWTSNTDDVLISGSSTVTALEGTVDLSKVTVTGGGEFERARRLTLTLTADSNAIADTPIVILDANNQKSDQGVTDSSGELSTTFNSATVDSNGITTANLNGYKAVTAAKVAYSTSNTGVADFRWARHALSLSDSSGNQESVALTNRFTYRMCYGFAGSYNLLAACSTNQANGHWTRPNGAGGTIEEYGYSNAMSGDLSGESILIDVPFAYLGGDTSFNNSNVFYTGSSTTGYANTYVGYPNGGDLYVDNADIIAVGKKGGTEAFNLGYYGGYNYGQFYVNNSRLINLGSIGSGASFYIDEPVIRVTNNTMVHYWAQEFPPGVYQQQICVSSAGNSMGTDGISNYLVDNNDMYGCTVAAMVYSNTYAWSPSYSGNGTDSARWTNNNIHDSTYLAFWMYLNAYCGDHLIADNVITGSLTLQYGAYTQDQTCDSLDIIDNSFGGNLLDPIYLRGQGAGVGTEYHIDGNDIYGNGDASHAGIYLRNGWGSVSDNNLYDADGGINVYGVLSGRDIELNGNTITSTGGRINPVALGIVLENCGLRTINMDGNDVTTTANALVSEGCNVNDVGSTFTATGGAAAGVSTVDIMASYFTPQNIAISTGDSIRWRAIQYYGGSPYIHTTTSDVGSTEQWDSGQMNLGSTFVHTFNTAGTYNYHCSSHAFMTGSVTVTNSTGGSTNLRTTGITALDGNEKFSFNGTAIGGFSNGISMDGGYLTLKGNAIINADYVGVDASNVHVTVDGASINTDDAYGVSMSALSSSTRHTLDITDMSTSGRYGMVTTGHGDWRWNGGTSSSDTTVKTVYGAAGSIENMSWADTNTQIDAGAYSVVTSVGNTLLSSKIAMTSTSLIHEGNLLDLTVTHMGSPASNVGVMIKSQMQGQWVDFSRAEYTSPSMRGNVITVDGSMGDWDGAYAENTADDAMPGTMAFTQTAGMKITWDQSNLYIGLQGATFTLLDGMIYLDTRPGGSTTADNWTVTHTLPFLADYMLFAEDTGDWGVKQLTTGNAWTDITSSSVCSGIRFYVGWGIPGLTAFNANSEFAIPWTCLGSPQGMIRWLALLHADPIFTTAPGLVVGIFPLQQVNLTCFCAQSFFDYGTLNVDANNGDLADGQLDDYLLIRRTWFNLAGNILSTPDRSYQVMAKVKDADRIYWDWGTYQGLSMTENRAITIDILRAKPIIQSLDDVEYDEDTGVHTISLTDKAQDYQEASSALTWTVQNDPSTPSNSSAAFDYELNGQDLTITTNTDLFGNLRLLLTVEDGHGLSRQKSILVSIQNVNDKPIIWNHARPSDGVPVFFEDTVNGVINVYDEPQRRDPTTGDELDWDIIRKNLGNSNGDQFVKDDALEQDASAQNNSEQSPQRYTWTAVTDPVDCTPFSVSVLSNTLEIDLNEDNEAGGTCDIVLDLSDGASFDDAADTFNVPFTVNPVNDAPVILDWNATKGNTVTVANGSSMTDTTPTANAWYWMVMEDDENRDNLTIDLAAMMSDNDHTIEQLTWEAEKATTCNYEHYFSLSIDNSADTLTIDLIDDATTDADSSQWDMLQDADGDGTPDNGIHQKMPTSGVYCIIKLWLHDTTSAPPQYDYSQSSTGVYQTKSDFEYLYVRVHNVDETRPDYSFDTERWNPFDFHNVYGVLSGTTLPVTVGLEYDGDQPPYNYEHDVRVWYSVDNIRQSSVRLGDNGPGSGDQALPAHGGSTDVQGWVTLNRTSQEVKVFAEILTVNPYSNQYVTSNIRRPALEEMNWENNNLTTADVEGSMPFIVEVRAAASVTSFAPTLMTISLVGAFVGMLLLNSRRREDEDEFEEENLFDDEEAVSPVIATILLVAITVVLAGVIYVWAGSLADTNVKGVPRLTFQAEANTADADQANWYWMIKTTYAATPLATQAITVSAQWTNTTGQQFYKTQMAPYPGGDSDMVYGRVPSNSPNMVTFYDDLDCDTGPCVTTYNEGDRIYVRMNDNDGLIQNMEIHIQYEVPGGAAYVLKQYTASPNSIR